MKRKILGTQEGEDDSGARGDWSTQSSNPQTGGVAADLWKISDVMLQRTLKLPTQASGKGPELG